MATGHNSFSVVAETSSPVLAKLQQTYRLYSGTRKYQTYQTVRSLSRVLDNETKGRTRYYQTWLHVAECKKHRRTTCHIKLRCMDIQKQRCLAGEGKRTLSMYVEFTHSRGRHAHISCCTDSEIIL